MKKLLITLFVLLLLSGCSVFNKEEAALEFSKDVEEISLKYKYSYSSAKATLTKAKYLEFNRDDEVVVINEDDNYYYVDYYGLTLAVEKMYVRKNDEADYASWLGYTKSNTIVYENSDLTSYLKSFKQNENVTVLDEIDGVLYVEYGDGEFGYIPSSLISTKKIVYVAPKKVEEVASSGGGDGGSSSSSSGSSSSSDVGNERGSAMAATGIYKEVFFGLDKTEPNAKIKANKAAAYIIFYNRDDVVKYTEIGDDYIEVLVNGHLAQVDKDFLRTEKDSSYTSFTGYVRAGAVIYSDYDLSEKVDSLAKNDKVKVIDQIGDKYVVELDDGSVGYMLISQVSKTYIAYVAPKKVEEVAVDSGYSGGGGSSSPAPDPTPTWSVTVLD